MWCAIALLINTIPVALISRSKQYLILLLLSSIQDTTNALLVNKSPGNKNDKIINDL